MMTATALFASLLCVGMCATADNNSVLACNLKAISTTERPRYSELLKRIRAAIKARAEIADGYKFTLDSKTVTLPEAAEWITFERLCCPFLKLQLSAAGNQTHWLLTLTGPEGVKPLIVEEFPVPGSGRQRPS